MTTVTPRAAYFEGHFPARPILPGVALLAIVLELQARGRRRAEDLAATFEEAVAKSAELIGIREEELMKQCDLIVNATTVATNALLERRGARVALITTEGFADVIEIGRQDRPSLYDIWADRPEPLVPRDLRFEVGGRLDAQLRVGEHGLTQAAELGDEHRAEVGGVLDEVVVAAARDRDARHRLLVEVEADADRRDRDAVRGARAGELPVGRIGPRQRSLDLHAVGVALDRNLQAGIGQQHARDARQLLARARLEIRAPRVEQHVGHVDDEPAR